MLINNNNRAYNSILILGIDPNDTYVQQHDYISKMSLYKTLYTPYGICYMNESICNKTFNYISSCTIADVDAALCYFVIVPLELAIDEAHT